jgi:restriction system protein
LRCSSFVYGLSLQKEENDMTVWVVRAGKYGERESYALDNNRAVVGWSEIGDMTKVATREKLNQLMQQTYPDEKANTLINHTGQLWAFVNTIKKGDIIALPMKTRSVIAFGEVVGDYEFFPDAPEEANHSRAVKWISKDISRNDFDSDIRFSLGGAMTVFRVERNDAENRIRQKLQKKGTPQNTPKKGASVQPAAPTAEEAPLEIERFALDQISEVINRKFKGHRLSHLIAGILEAQGYTVFVSPPGPDDGVDIIAGQGKLGFESPRLCVQVKSGDDPASRDVLDQLQGVIKKFGADQGLLVSWSGFKDTVHREARRTFFQIRLWDASDIMRAIQDNYEMLPDEIKAELPLKRVWVYVNEE